MYKYVQFSSPNVQEVFVEFIRFYEKNGNAWLENNLFFKKEQNPYSFLQITSRR